MNTTFVFYYFVSGRLSTKEVQGFDIINAIQNSGVAPTDILAVKTKLVTEAVTGI